MESGVIRDQEVKSREILFNNCFLILSFYVIYVNKSNIHDALSKERHKRASKIGTKVQLAFGRDEDGF